MNGDGLFQRGGIEHGIRTPVPALLLALALLTGCSQQIHRPAPLADPVMYPLPPAPARIAFLTSISDETFMGYQPDRLSRFLFGHDTEVPKTITKPFGMAAKDDTLLVCDTQQNCVHVLDFKDGKFATLGDAGQGQLLKPVDVAIDDLGNRYVADASRREIVVFSADNQPIRALQPAGDDHFKPVAIAFRNDRLYVLNAERHRVEVLDPQSGALLDAFGEQGTGPGQMFMPNGLAVDSKGLVYVTDLLNCRVQVFSPDGELLRSFGQPGDRAGQFSRPKHLDIGPGDIIYVVDAAFQRVQMFDSQGRVLMLFGGPGNASGGLTLPAGVCVSRSLLPHFAQYLPPGFAADYLVFVSDQFGPHKIGVYAFGQMKPATQSQ